MAAQRTRSQDQVGELLRTAGDSLGLSLTFLSRLDGETQHLEVVESSIPLFRDGITQPQETSFCQAILDGRLPTVIPNVAKLPEAKKLPAARFPRIRSFVSVPVHLSDGSVYGTFCAAGFKSDKGLSKRDEALMSVLAKAAATIIEPDLRTRERETEIQARMEPLLRCGGPDIVVQPIVSLDTRKMKGVEALSRFPANWQKPPDICFEEAAEIGLGITMELLALEGAIGQLSQVEGYVAMNASPGTAVDPRCQELLLRTDLERVVLELSEHDPVDDYDTLHKALAPLRDAGMRLAIDDVGAGYSSLRHIVVTRPDIIKLDRSIVDGIHEDPTLKTLVRSLVQFGHDCGAVVVAEGVETEQDAQAVFHAGVDLGQGWLFGRPVPAIALDKSATSRSAPNSTSADNSPNQRDSAGR